MFWAWGTDCINGVVSWDLSLRSSAAEIIVDFYTRQRGPVYQDQVPGDGPLRVFE